MHLSSETGVSPGIARRDASVSCADSIPSQLLFSDCRFLCVYPAPMSCLSSHPPSLPSSLSSSLPPSLAPSPPLQANILELAEGPLSRHFSSGRTRMLVNGRELHRRDLGVLQQRGLVEQPGAAFLLDIDGHLADATTGEELPPGLGKLAPS